MSLGNKLICALYFKTVMAAKAVRKGQGKECLAPASLDSSRFCPLPPPPPPPQRWLWVPLPTRQCPLGTAQARYDAPSFDLLYSASDFSLLAICCSGVDGMCRFANTLLPPRPAVWHCQVPMFQGWRVSMYFGMLGVFLYPGLFWASS